MRLSRLCTGSLLCLLLSGCLLLPSQTDLMLALLRPLVGFDPNTVNLFEQPIIHKRMTTLLGPHYDNTMRLLRTANTIQREGALFYVVSRYTPIPTLAQKAGLVWNADTNQMAIGLLKGDSAQIYYEVVEQRIAVTVAEAGEAVEQRVDEEKAKAEQRIDETVGGALRQVMPIWPQDIAAWLHPERIIEEAIRAKIDAAATRAVEATVDAIAPQPKSPYPETETSSDSVSPDATPRELLLP